MVNNPLIRPYIILAGGGLGGIGGLGPLDSHQVTKWGMSHVAHNPA